jgi:hypothetical protein
MTRRSAIWRAGRAFSEYLNATLLGSLWILAVHMLAVGFLGHPNVLEEVNELVGRLHKLHCCKRMTLP